MSKVWLERKEESWEIKLDPATLTLTNEKGEHYGVRWEIFRDRTTLKVTKYEKSFITGEWRPVVSASLSSLLEPLLEPDEDEEVYEKPWYLDEQELQDFIRRENVEECCKFILKLVKDNFSYMFFDAFLEEVTKDKKVE
jgi:DNA repair exonuclease SbcCD ATPase subunit